MLLIIQKSIRAKICHGIHWYLKANKKYMKDNDKNKKPPYLKYWEVNNVYGWAISQNLPLGCFKWVEEISQSNKGFIKSYNLDSDMEYFLEGDIHYLEELHRLHNDLLFFTRKNENQKVSENIADMFDKKEYIMHIKNSNEASTRNCIESLNSIKKLLQHHTLE